MVAGVLYFEILGRITLSNQQGFLRAESIKGLTP